MALLLFSWQVLELRRQSWTGVFAAMAAVHALLVCAWEWQRSRPAPWLTDTWGPRLMLATGFAALLVPSTAVIVAADAARAGPVAAGLVIACAAVALWYYRQRRTDLFMLTAVAGAGFVLVSVVAGRVLFEDLSLGMIGPLLMAMVIIGEVALAVAWLKWTLRGWSES